MKEMSFWDHLEELRQVILQSALVVIALGVIFFFTMEPIFDSLILAPCRGNFILYRAINVVGSWIPGVSNFAPNAYNVQLVNINLTAQFFIHMSTACWMAVMFAFPYVIYKIWGFVSLGMYEYEKQNPRKAFFVCNLMFYLGITFGYLLVFPLTLRFLASYQISSSIPNQITLESYMGSFISLIFMMGLVFELPLLCWLLSRMGLITRDLFAKYRRYAVVGFLVLAALITPSGDPFTLLVVFMPLYLLYEISAKLAVKR